MDSHLNFNSKVSISRSFSLTYPCILQQRKYANDQDQNTDIVDWQIYHYKTHGPQTTDELFSNIYNQHYTNTIECTVSINI